MFFSGRYEHSVDPKGRVSLPAKFRKVLSDDLMLVPGFDGELCLFDEEGYEEWINSLFEDRETGKPNTRSTQDRTALRAIYANTVPVMVDSAGRIMIPKKMRERVGIDRNATIVGSRDHLEIWDPTQLDAGQSEDFLPAGFLID